MRVLYLTNIPSPYRVDFFNELGTKCELTVLFERSEASNRNNQWFNKNNKYFNAIFLKGKKVRPDSAINFEVIKHLNKKKYDIIIVGGYATPTGMLAINYLKLKRIPFILNADGGFINKNESWIKKLVKKYYISSASFWLSTGQETSNYLKYYGASSKQIFIYPFTSLYSKEILNTLITQSEKNQIKEELGLKSDKIVISVGRFIDIKGMDILINAWSKMKVHDDRELIIIGGGDLECNYWKLINKKGLSNIKIIDFQNKEQLIKYYKAADAMALMTRGDIWGLVINEALACGLPVITTDRCIAGVELIKNNENGFIIPVDNIEATERKLSFMLDDRASLQKFSQRSLDYIREYNIENMALSHINIFNKVLGENA